MAGNPKWNPSYGVLNDVGKPLIHRRVDYDGISVGTIVNHLTEEAFTPDSLANTGPYKGIVLRVEPGDLEAGTGLSQFFGSFFSSNGKPSLVKIKVRIPELHAMLPIPDSIGHPDSEHALIDMYPTFVAQNQGLPTPGPGSIVWVDFGNKNNFSEPVYLEEVLHKENTPIAHGNVSGKNKHLKACAGKFLSNGPSGDQLSGKNKALAHSGLPIQPRKPASVLSGDYAMIKGLRPSAEASEKWAKSIKSKGVPGKTWIGGMPSNGLEDPYHKIGKRDTIIYAPNATDFSAPVELIYFFHGRGEFGNPYDFQSRFAPACRRMTTAGRNFVLVVPELPWCYGYKKVKGSTPIKAAWSGNDSLSKFHGDVMDVLKSDFSEKIKVGFTTIVAHSQGGQALYQGLDSLKSIGVDKIVCADATGWSSSKSWAVEVWNKFAKNNDVEFDVLVSVSGWLEKTAQQAQKTITGEKVYFDYINTGGGPTGHRKVGDLGLEYISPALVSQKNAKAEAAIKAVKKTPVSDYDAEESLEAEEEMAKDKGFSLSQPTAKLPPPKNADTSPSAINKKKTGVKAPKTKKAIPFTEARVYVKDYGTLSGTSDLLVSVPASGKPVKLHKLAAKRFALLNQAWQQDFPNHPPMKIASGWRPRGKWGTSYDDYTQYLIKEYKSVDVGKKWKAFESAHETGLAFDIGNNGLTPSRKTNDQQKKTVLYKWLVETAHNFGISPYKHEAWHWEVRIPKESWLSGKEFTDDLAVLVTDPGETSSDYKPRAESDMSAENCVKTLGNVVSSQEVKQVTAPQTKTKGSLDKSEKRKLIIELSREFDVEPEMVYAFFAVESGGKSGFDKTTGKALIRFEPHVFADPKRMAKAGVSASRVPWAGNSSRERKEKWRALGYRHGTVNDNTYDQIALNAALKINEELAYVSISTGAAQIMGFNHRAIGYKSAKEQYEAFAASEESQIRGFFTFVKNRGNGKMMEALKQKDFVTAALYYNGRGKQELYGAKIKANYEKYKRTGLPGS